MIAAFEIPISTLNDFEVMNSSKKFSLIQIIPHANFN